MLENPKADSEAHKDETDPFGAIEQVLQQPTIAGTKRVVTPRTWAQSIGNSYKKILIDLFNDAHDETGMSGEEYYQTLIDKSIREKQMMMEIHIRNIMVEFFLMFLKMR